MRINLLSATCSALAHVFLFLVIERSLRPADVVMRRVGATCAVLMSATAFTVWHQSNVNEKVYTLSFLTTMLVLWLALRWRDTRNAKLLVAAAYITVLSATNHLMGVLVAPAVLLFVYRVDRRALLSTRVWATTLPLAALALSVQLFLPIRAAEQPLVNESDPACESLLAATASIYTNGARGCEALSATLTREQYGKPSILDDPNTPGTPRGAELMLSQFVNYFQYLDWQWARSVNGRQPLFGREDSLSGGDDSPFGVRPLITLLVLVGLLAEIADQAPEEDPGCLYASFCYEARLLDDAVRAEILETFAYWHERLTPWFDAALANATTRIEGVTPGDLLALLDTVFEGGLVMARIQGDRLALGAQLRQYRNYLELLFAR